MSEGSESLRKGKVLGMDIGGLGLVLRYPFRLQISEVIALVTPAK